MFDNLEIFGMASGLAKHAAMRHAAIAGNIANADTPGYRARDVADFSDVYRTSETGTGMRFSRAGHIGGPSGDGSFPLIDRPGPSAPNGNTVSLETEMLKATEIRHQHEMALSVYQTSLGILRTSLGRGR